ncbi:hypothetical protein L484_008648 [Morus notabilis]|uniref:IST1-like protein n=1 Tax=Morus notabilis TaxID=981085 RepID=W9RM52_9ROSA|nr:uncharacterized protein LOC21392007 [Morus notabilis]EXB97158.1 hypothetical protein L484_008648 [Morus notabilis]
MGRKLDALLGRNFKTSKFKTLLKLASSRIAILANQHQSRLSHARSDVKDLLLIGQQDCAMLRVEHVIMEQNKLDAFSLIEYFCQLLLERVKLIAQSKGECPEELKEATSSLIYAASRCGEFPELQKIREVLTPKFGKDFATRAVELRNNCEVNPKIVQKFSTRRSSLESRLKFLKEIASEAGVILNLEEYTPVEDKEKLDANQNHGHIEPTKASKPDENGLTHNTTLLEDIKQVEKFSETMKARRKYTDVADAAQEAFESAAYAAAAARAAVELSMCKSMDNKDRDESDNQRGTVSDIGVSSTNKALVITSYAASEKIEDLVNRLGSQNERIHPIEDLERSESEGEDDMGYESLNDNPLEVEVENEKKETERKSSASCADIEEKDSKKWPENLPVNENKHNRLSNASTDDKISNEDSIIKLSSQSPE